MNEAIKSLDDYERDPNYLAKVVSIRRITPEYSAEDVREIVLDVDRPDFPYKVGQSIGVLAPGSPAFGNRYHFRLYSVADLPDRSDAGTPRIKICVRRCSYIDEYSGESYPGVASNYLCNLRPGNTVPIAGPFGLAFAVPEEHDANLILIGSGTGIAPFRALVKHIYREVPDWTGPIWLFYGAQRGIELLYMNDEMDDFSQYYDRETFEAFQALSPRPNWADPIAWDQAIEERSDELWSKLEDPKTYVYVAGLSRSLEQLDEVFAGLAGSKDRWARRKAELMAGKRWVELVY